VSNVATPSEPEEQIDIEKGIMYEVFGKDLAAAVSIGEVLQLTGRVSRVSSGGVWVTGLSVPMDSRCDITTMSGTILEALVVGFSRDETILQPLLGVSGISPNDVVSPAKETPYITVGPDILGKVIDPTGRVLGGLGGSTLKGNKIPLASTSPGPMTRRLISDSLQTGIKVIDSCLPLAKGQRIGLFAGAGVGKSTLLGMFARNTEAEINVVALVGERGRELREFMDEALGQEALKKTVIVSAPADASPLMRTRCAEVATTISEYFREQGKDVLLFLDSLTRYAMAQRETGLMMGEVPTTRGYPASCFSNMSRLIERAGLSSSSGSLTAIYTVLVEGDDLTDPIADAAIAILDGHIILSRDLSSSGIYPPVDVLRSVSRVANKITTEQQRHNIARLRSMMSEYDKSKDMINMGAYEYGSNPILDEALTYLSSITDLFKQSLEQSFTIDQSIQMLKESINGA